MKKRKYLFFANADDDAVIIPADKVRDLNITGASGTSKLSVNYSTDAGGDGSVELDTSDSDAAARAIQRAIATSSASVINVADDVKSVYMTGITACNTITHS